MTAGPSLGVQTSAHQYVFSSLAASAYSRIWLARLLLIARREDQVSVHLVDLNVAVDPDERAGRELAVPHREMGRCCGIETGTLSIVVGRLR